jgi:NADH-quinone oxidoreductase subunit E
VEWIDERSRKEQGSTGMTNFRTSVLTLDRPGDPSVFDETTRAEAAAIIARYPDGQSRSALLPMLHLVQSVQSQITPDGIAFCSDKLGLSKAQVAAVATFYTMYKRTPTGEYLVSVCTNTLCGMLGGDEIFAALKDELGIGNNQTTADGKITLEHAECLAACDYAPVVTVNYEFFDNQTVQSATDLVGKLQSDAAPDPTRGAPLCSFKKISRQIAGFFDDAAAVAADANGSGIPTEIGVKMAIAKGESAPSYAVDAPAMSAPPVATAPVATAPAKRAPRKAAADPVDDGAQQLPLEVTSAHDAPLTTHASDDAAGPTAAAPIAAAPKKAPAKRAPRKATPAIPPISGTPAATESTED